MMFKSTSKTHVGHVRACNEDSFVANEELGLWLVADGVGGNGFGDFASQVVSQTVERKLRLGSTLKASIVDAHKAIIKLGENKPDVRGMASTVVAAQFKGERFVICWVGDSRAYLISETEIEPLTADHNQAQYLFEQGEITANEVRTHPAQRILMHAVGVDDEHWLVDQVEGKLFAGETLLLCSDGLTGELADDEIFASFKKEHDLECIANNLIEKALGRGGSDNITVTLVSLDKTLCDEDNINNTQPLVSAVSESTNKPGSAVKFIAFGIMAALLLVAVALSFT
jgi:PPM family protein phosphatase